MAIPGKAWPNLQGAYSGSQRLGDRSGRPRVQSEPFLSRYNGLFIVDGPTCHWDTRSSSKEPDGSFLVALECKFPFVCAKQCSLVRFLKLCLPHSLCIARFTFLSLPSQQSHPLIHGSVSVSLSFSSLSLSVSFPLLSLSLSSRPLSLAFLSSPLSCPSPSLPLPPPHTLSLPLFFRLFQTEEERFLLQRVVHAGDDSSCPGLAFLSLRRQLP